jgi:hypothetical protein
MKQWILVGALAAVLSINARAGQTAMLDDQPWPMQQGKLLSGTAQVLAEIAWDGTPISGCIEQSTGSAALDQAALVRIARHHVAMDSQTTLPHNVMAHAPVILDPEPSPSDTLVLPPQPKHACVPVELPAYEPAMARRQLEAAHTVTYVPDAKGLVPGTTAPWPRDAAGRLVSEEVLSDYIVEPGRVDDKLMLVDPSRSAADNPVFLVATARALKKVPINEPATPRHAALFRVRFTVPTDIDGAQLPVYADNTPEGKEGTRLGACSVVADFAYMMSRDHREGVSKTDGVARAKKVANGLFPEMIDKLGGIIYLKPPLFGSVMDDQFHRTNALSYCVAVLGPPTG